MSLSAFQQKIEEYNNQTSALKQKLDETYSALQAIDPSAPGAKEQRSAAIKAFNESRASLAASRDQTSKEANEIIKNLSGDERSQADDLLKSAINLNRANIDYQKNTVVPFSESLKDKIKAGNKETNPSEADKETEKKYENSEVVAASKSNQTNENDNSTSKTLDNKNNETNKLGRNTSLPAGAMPKSAPPVNVNFININGDQQPKDMRVKIRVPKNYLTDLTKGPGNITGILGEFGGIVFPYTPQIGLEHKAEYQTQNPVHSNYTQYFYKSSNVSAISISGKFSVANEKDAMVYIAVVHLLRALTKMRSGGTTGDFDSGAPPPVCRLDAYGTFMLDNVPVVISSYKLDLPDNVDYYTVGKISGTQANNLYEKTAVPVVSTVSITCLPVYSRNEIQRFSVSQWLANKSVRKAGFL